MIPTRLYIKKHSKTGLLYFGKTTRRNVYTYTGSGKRWINHINTHGTEFIETIWVKEFTDQDELTSFALAFSEIFDIVNDSSWANLTEENGLDGAPVGYLVSEETRQKMSQSQTGVKRTFKGKQPVTQEHRDNMSKALTGRIRSDAEREAISKGRKGIKPGDEQRRKMSEAAKKRVRTPHSEETKAKMREAALHRKIKQ